MTVFQIISIIFSVLVLIGAIAGVYIKSAVAIAKIEVEIVNIKKDIQEKDINIRDSVNLLDANNRENYREIIAKVDKLIVTLVK